MYMPSDMAHYACVEFTKTLTVAMLDVIDNVRAPINGTRALARLIYCFALPLPFVENDLAWNVRMLRVASAKDIRVGESKGRPSTTT